MALFYRYGRKQARAYVIRGSLSWPRTFNTVQHSQMSILTHALPRNDEQHRTSSEVIQHLHHTLRVAARPSSASQILDLTGQIILQDRFAAAHGGFADVYIALWHREQATPLKVYLAWSTYTAS